MFFKSVLRCPDRNWLTCFPRLISILMWKQNLLSHAIIPPPSSQPIFSSWSPCQLSFITTGIRERTNDGKYDVWAAELLFSLSQQSNNPLRELLVGLVTELLAAALMRSWGNKVRPLVVQLYSRLVGWFTHSIGLIPPRTVFCRLRCYCCSRSIWRYCVFLCFSALLGSWRASWVELSAPSSRKFPPNRIEFNNSQVETLNGTWSRAVELRQKYSSAV